MTKGLGTLEAWLNIDDDDDDDDDVDFITGLP